MTLRPTKTVIDRCVNVPARDAPGRNGRSWGSHMNPPLNSCINVGLSGRWAHDAHVWFFRTCRMRLDDAVGDLLTSWGRIQVCVRVSLRVWVRDCERIRIIIMMWFQSCRASAQHSFMFRRVPSCSVHAFS